MSPENKAIEQAAETARRYLDQILLDPLAEFGLLLKDNVSSWRFKNQVRMVEKAREYLESKGIDGIQIANKILPDSVVPLIEARGDTSDPTLSDLFAGLLASAVDPDTAETTHPSFARILSQLAPLDATILLKLHRALEVSSKDIANGNIPEGYNDKIPMHRQLGYEAGRLAPSLQKAEDVINLSFQNLRRLGVCDYGHDFLSLANQVPRISFTDFGLSFIKASTQNVTNG